MESHEDVLNGGRCLHPGPRQPVPPAASSPESAPRAGRRSVPGRPAAKGHGRLAAAVTAVLTSAVMVAGTPLASAASAAVPVFGQQLGNDCEATSLRMVLAARGVQVSDQDVLGRIGVDLAHPQAGVSGPLSGDPFRAFVGDPGGSEAAGTGFGVYYPPIAQAAQSYGLSTAAAGQGISPPNCAARLPRDTRRSSGSTTTGVTSRQARTPRTTVRWCPTPARPSTPSS